MVNDILLTIPQVAAQIGSTESAIRTAKSRNKDRLFEGIHQSLGIGIGMISGEGNQLTYRVDSL